MKKALFGPAGNSDSFASVSKRSVDAPKWLRDMGLDAYEYQCGNGVRLSAETGAAIGAACAENGIAPSLHAPYYISLANPENVEKNIGYLLASARAVTALGGRRITVHTGAVSGRPRAEALACAKAMVRVMCRALDEAGFGHVIPCLETMGKLGQLGTLEEVLALCQAEERLLPCIDFGHLYARSLGETEGYEATAALFDLLENALGRERASGFHAHFSKIAYSKGGETRHLTFADPDFGPDYRPVMRLIAERGYHPTVICESRGTQAEDALEMKAYYHKMLEARPSSRT
ncbi:TIM barrel protein [Oscillospiraceae bacterium OttesenSCG-928-F05]|nr:TIM barrel protein [Oscillospiraceae bacterium OttesenSCG-928-F05]